MSKIVISIFVVAFLFLSMRSSASASEVIVPVIDGMTIQLGNTLQQLKVRAKSFGPGFCGVKFIFYGSGTYHLLAPPLKWSKWTKLGAAFAGVAIKIGFVEVCDTGAIAEIRYYK